MKAATMRAAALLSGHLLAAAFLTAPVSAHAAIEPREAVADRRAILTLVVPAEVGPIQEVHMRPPLGFEVDFVEAKPGWTLATETGHGGKITEARWKAATPLPRGQFVEFRFRAVAEKSAAYNWSVEEHLTRVVASPEEEAKGHAEQTRQEGAHSHETAGTVRKWTPSVTVVSQDALSKAAADLETARTSLSQLQQSYSQISTANAQNLQAAQSAATAAYAGIGLGVVALLVAAVSVLRRKP